MAVSAVFRAGDEDDGNARVDRADLLVDREPGLIGQTQIEKNHVRAGRTDSVDAHGPGGDRCDLVTGGRKCLTHLLRQERQIVVDQEDMGHPVVRMVLANVLPSRLTFPGSTRIVGDQLGAGAPWRRTGAARRSIQSMSAGSASSEHFSPVVRVREVGVKWCTKSCVLADR
jgi:hypothetical protein